MNSGETRSDGTPSSFQFLARRALRFWRSAAVVVVVGCAITLVVAKKSDQPYKSESVLMVDQGVPREIGAPDTSQAGARLRDMLYAGERLDPVVRDFNLYPELSRQQALEEVKKRIHFTMQPGATYSVAYVGTSPGQAQAITRRLTETLIADHNVQRGQAVRDARTFLDSERTQLVEEMRLRESALKEFLARHPEATTAEQPEPLMEDPSVILLEQELARLHTQARPRASAGGGPARSTAEVLELRQQVEAERAKAERDLRDKLDTLTEAHPDVIVARERVKRAQADSQRFSAANKAPEGAAPTAGDDGEVKQSIRDLEGRIGRMRSVSRSRYRRDPQLLQLAVQLQRLRGDLGESRERLARLEDQHLQARVVEKMETQGNLLRLRVLDPATLPGSPLQSRRRRIAFAGLVLSCLLGTGMAFGRATGSDRVFDREDVANLTGVGVLTVVPRATRGRRTHV